MLTTVARQYRPDPIDDVFTSHGAPDDAISRSGLCAFFSKRPGVIRLSESLCALSSRPYLFLS